MASNSEPRKIFDAPEVPIEAIFWEAKSFCTRTMITGIQFTAKNVGMFFGIQCNFTMCNKLNSVYWVFHILVNYITVCTLHFCISRFEGKIFGLYRLINS